MKTKKILIMLTFQLMLSVISTAQSTYDFQSVLKMGLQHSHQMKISTADSLERALEVKKAKLNYTPEVSVSGQGMLLNQPNIEFMGQPSSMMAPKNATVLMGSVGLPVFTGFQLKNNLEMNKELELAEAQNKATDSTIVMMQIIESYLGLYKAQQSKLLIDESIKTAEKRVADFEKLKENEIITENDLLKAKLQLSRLKTSQVSISAQEELVSYQLSLLTGISEDQKITVNESIFTQVPEIITQEQFEKILLNRSDYQALEHQMKASEYVVEMQKSHYYPQISLSGMYVSAYVPNTITINNMINAGVTIKYNISALYKNGTSVELKKQELNKINAQIEQLTDQIKLQTHKGFLDFQTATSQEELYMEMVEQSDENYKEVKSKFDNQLATVVDLLEAETQKLQAEIDLKIAKANKFWAFCNYLKTSGTLNKLKTIR